MSSAAGTPSLQQIVLDAFQQLFKSYPWLAWLLIVLVVVYLGVGIWRAWTAEESSLFWGVVKWKTGSAERKELLASLREVITSNRFLGLLLLIIRSSLERFDRIRHGGLEKSTNDDGLRYLCEWLARAMGFQFSDINKVTLFVPDGDPATATQLKVLAHSGISNESARSLRLEIHETNPTFAALAFLTGEVHVCQDVGTDQRYRPLKYAPEHQYKSILAVPIKHGNKVIACFTLDSLVAGRFGADEENQGKLFAPLFALFLGAGGATENSESSQKGGGN
jgi:GAF domain